MAFNDLTVRSAVESAINEFEEIGREAFLSKYGFGPARTYFLIHQGSRYDSKAILGAAHGYQFPDIGPLSHKDFSGGERRAAKKLRSLGFEVTSSNMGKNYWLIIEKSDETRTSQGIEGYRDITGVSYHYDSLVPNYKNIASGDSIVLRKENEILGIGEISDISESADVKVHSRCTRCKSTDIRKRSKKLPKWKCGKCANEFNEPAETIVNVRSYTASIKEFEKLNSPPSVRDVKLCASSGDGVSSQLSIIQLDETKIRSLLDGVALIPSSRQTSPKSHGQGFGLSQPERKAVEMHAMDIARELYERKGWALVDKSGSHPFDLLATKDLEKRYVEVKGTTGEGKSIILTRGEVDHVKKYNYDSALVVVSNIRLNKENGEWIASGGKVSIHEDPWRIKDTCLKATQYRYEVE